jgi:hypothetical protein
MYKQPFVKRLPRQHYSPRLLPLMCYEQDGKLFEAMAEAKGSLGTVVMTSKTPEFHYLEVTLNAGTIVPALRRASDDNLFCIVQNMQYKILTK